MKLKFSLETSLIHINAIFENCYASAILDRSNVGVLYFKHSNVYRPVQKNETAKKLFWNRYQVIRWAITSRIPGCNYSSNLRVNDNADLYYFQILQ